MGYAEPDDTDEVVEQEEMSEDDTDETNNSIGEKLYMFFTIFGISNRAMSYLLAILEEEGLNVPSSVYLLKKPFSCDKKVDVIKSTLNCGGEFVYLSIEDNIKYCIDNNLIQLTDKYTEFRIMLNIDGLPLFRSSPVNIWPILVSFRDYDFGKPLPVGVYVGVKKPDFSGFVSQLHSELLRLQNYVQICNFFIKVIDITFICDAPARSFLQCVKGHSGYNACPYCTIHGEYIHNKVVFPYLAAGHAERTDDKYMSSSENNQLSRSPLVEVVSLKTGFPPEYMHLVCLGIMRRLLQSYMSNTHGLLPCRLSEGLKMQLNDRIKAHSNILPREFQRKVRPLSNYVHFKATELRTLLLYTGPIFFKNILSDEYYSHFLLLHFAIYVYISPNLSRLYEFAEECLNRFLFKIKDLFGMSGYTYNAHCLVHLPEFVRRLGPLDTFSAFPYENYLSHLKKRIKTGSYVLTQTVNSLQTMRNICVQDAPRSLHFSASYPNNCAIIRHCGADVPLLINSVCSKNKKTFVSGCLLKFSSCFYTSPHPSAVLGIGYYSESRVSISDVEPVSKCILVKDNNRYLVLPYACIQSVQ